MNALFVTSTRLRVLCTLVVIPVLWFIDAPWHTRVTIMAMVIAYLVVANFVEHIDGGSDKLPVAPIVGALGALVALSVSILDPDLRVGALFGYLIIVVYASGAGRKPAGYVIAGIAIVLGVGSELFREHSLPASVLVAFAGCVVVLAAFVEALKKRAERSARLLKRVHEAMMSVTTSPDFDETLDSIVGAASKAVHGAGSGILLREGDHLVLAAPTAMRDALPPGVVARSTKVELREASSPLAACVIRGETVVVPDIDADEMFVSWTRNYRKRVAFPSHAVVAIPLWAGDEVVGAMQTLFPGPIPEPRETVRLLEAYAEQVTLVIVRTQAYEQERRAAERLGEANQMRSDFLALVSHELRTPLTAAKGFVDTVLYQWDKLEDDRRKELLARASRNAEELTRLIDKLLAYSGLEAHPVLDVRPVALAEAIDHVREHCAPALGDHEVVVDVPDRLYARADAHAFGHLVENLLTNAAKFGPPGTPIIIEAALDGGEIVVRVSDEGPGIPESEQEAIFERFYRSPAHRSASRGTGLGLTIARRAADALGGRLWVESELGHGATFVFTLPAATVEPGPGLTPSAATDRLDQPV